MRVLFVCSGNICRSPMAEALFNHKADLQGLSGLHAESAGTLGIRGEPASGEAILALAEQSIDLRPHRSQALTMTRVQSADVVVAMDAGHVQVLNRRHGGTARHLYLIRAFESGVEPTAAAEDLPDPVGQPIELFREQVRVLTPCVDHLIRYLDGGGCA